MNAEPPADLDDLPAVAQGLGVVIPVYNEPAWVVRAVDALVAAAELARLPLEIVIVDDGSTDDTPAVLDDLATRTGARVLHQVNAGRLAARRAGVALVQSPWVLLLDSRVIVEQHSFRWLLDELATSPDRRVWCGHVDVETRRNPFAAFWSGLVKVGWRRYTARPRLVSFGAEEFDHYPKGTGCLLIPRTLLLEAADSFQSMYDVAHLASDDTRLLRYVAGQERIWLSPDFSFRYHGKDGPRGFVRQSYFRGTTFVDGYLGQPGAIRRALVAAIVGGGGLLALAVHRPKLGAAGVAAVLVTVPVLVRRCGGSADEVRATALLTPVFVPVFGSGVIRGLVLAAARAMRSRPVSPR